MSMPEQLSLIVSFLQQNPVWLISTVMLFSLCVGSFLNVVIYRLPVMMEKAGSRSIGNIFIRMPCSHRWKLLIWRRRARVVSIVRRS